MRQCLAATVAGEPEPMSSDQLEKLFLSLA
jgi:hypothetical protein